MIPILIAAVVLLGCAFVYQELRLRRLAAAIKPAENPAGKGKDAATCAAHVPAVTTPSEEAARARKLVELLFPVHAWHGIPPGEKAPKTVNAVIEIVPTDTVKYELDKHSGLLCIDRPQRYSSICPTLYGFIPRTLCAEEVGKACEARTGRQGIYGDGDPIDICVLSEKNISHGGILVRARPIGGLRMIDGNKADDKIIAVLEDDLEYGDIQELSELKKTLLDRLRHYFLSYKQLPGEEKRQVEITHVYGREEAEAIIGCSINDYRAHYGAPESRLEQLRQLIASGH